VEKVSGLGAFSLAVAGGLLIYASWRGIEAGISRALIAAEFAVGLLVLCTGVAYLIRLARAWA
jgi:hypothetical protein